MSNDQEDVFDCNVNGPALAAVGRSLGLHTEEDLPPSPDSDSGSDSESHSDSDSDSDPGGREKTKRPSLQKQKGDDMTLKAEEGADGPEGGNGGMTLSDLVWW